MTTDRDRVEAALRSYCFTMRAYSPARCPCNDKAACEAPEFPQDVEAMSRALAAADALSTPPALDREAVAEAIDPDKGHAGAAFAAADRVLALLPAAPPPVQEDVRLAGAKEAEVERLTRERDEALKAVALGKTVITKQCAEIDRLEAARQSCARDAQAAERERDALRKLYRDAQKTAVAAYCKAVDRAEAAERERDEARAETDVLAEDAAQQTEMLDRIANALGLVHDEGLEDVTPYVVAIARLREELAETAEQHIAALTRERDEMRAEVEALRRSEDEWASKTEVAQSYADTLIGAKNRLKARADAAEARLARAREALDAYDKADGVNAELVAIGGLRRALADSKPRRAGAKAMRHAREDYERFQDPAGLIPDEEPVFLIRGQDRVGAQVVRLYASLAEQAGADRDLVRRCRDHADRMDAWPKHKVPDLADSEPAGRADNGEL